MMKPSYSFGGLEIWFRICRHVLHHSSRLLAIFEHWFMAHPHGEPAEMDFGAPFGTERNWNYFLVALAVPLVEPMGMADGLRLSW